VLTQLDVEQALSQADNSYSTKDKQNIRHSDARKCFLTPAVQAPALSRTLDLYTWDVLGFPKNHPVFEFGFHAGAALSNFQADPFLRGS